MLFLTSKHKVPAQPAHISQAIPPPQTDRPAHMCLGSLPCTTRTCAIKSIRAPRIKQQSRRGQGRREKGHGCERRPAEGGGGGNESKVTIVLEPRNNCIDLNNVKISRYQVGYIGCCGEQLLEPYFWCYIPRNERDHDAASGICVVYGHRVHLDSCHGT